MSHVADPVRLIPKPDRRQAPDRHSQRRGGRRASDSDCSTGELASRVIASYAQQPGLTLTVEQAAGLIAVDVKTCSDVMLMLTRHGVLRLMPNGLFAMF
jgi:hypothetical protein